jgi:hypothetical protein
VLRVIGGGTVTKVLYRLCPAAKVAVVSERVTNPGPRLGAHHSRQNRAGKRKAPRVPRGPTHKL